jgi:hypothetical protein
MDQGQLDSLYQQYLGRGVDPSGAANWGGADYDTVVQGILGSQEYQNRNQPPQPQAQGMGEIISPSGGSDIGAIYRQYLNRDVDPSGAATYAGWDPQSIINAVTSSQEYRNRAGGGGGGQAVPLATPQAATYTPGPSYGEYNFEMTGKPSDAELVTNPDMANAWYRYSGTAPAPAMTWETAPSTVTAAPGLISFYGAYGLPKPFSAEDIKAPVDPNTIRYGYGNTPYAGVKSNVPGLMSGGEYIVDPKTNKFVLDANGDPIHVPIEPYKQGTFNNIMDNYLIPGFIAAAAIPVLGGLGGQALGAFGSGAELGAGAELMGPTYGELGYTGLEAGQFGPTYAELGYTGLNNAAAISAADAAAAAALANVGMSPSTLSNLVRGGATIASVAAKVFGNNQTPTQTNPSLLPRTTNPTGTNPNDLANALKGLSGLGQTQTGAGFGLSRGNVNPFTYAKDVPTQTLAASKADPFAALNVAQTPITPYNPLANLFG